MFAGQQGPEVVLVLAIGKELIAAPVNHDDHARGHGGIRGGHVRRVLIEGRG
jgi:hypothetical protein